MGEPGWLDFDLNSPMECNKDEALRARQIAEARMQRGEFAEALRFATKAKRLYADVENIAQIITVCEVHIAAQKKLSGCYMDWYAILQIEGLADEAAIIKPKTFWTCMLNCQHCKTKYGYGVLLANRTIYAVNTVGSHVKLAFLRLSHHHCLLR